MKKVNLLQLIIQFVDPNFNVMRTTDMESSSTAAYIVVALLVIASIVPLATWYFSKSKAN